MHFKPIYKNLTGSLILTLLFISFFSTPLFNLIPLTYGAPGAPIVSNENPQNGSIGIYTNPELSIFAADMDGDPLTIIFQTNATGTWQEIKRYTNVPSGTYTVIPSTMNQLGTKYYWSVAVTDGNTWVNKTYSFITTTTILSLKWTRTGVPRASIGVVIADVTGDGKEEIIHAGEGGVAVLDGTTGNIIWSRAITGVTVSAQCEVADLNNDGKPEIIVPIENPAGLHVLFGNGSTYWTITNLSGFLTPDPVIADIDGSGYPTIFIATMWTTSTANDGKIYKISHDGKILAEAWSWHPCAGGFSLADADGDGEFELYIGDRNNAYGDGNLGRGLRSLWASNLTVRWEYPTLLCSSHRPILADVNNDGILEVIMGHHRGGLGVFDSRTGNPIKYSSSSTNFPIHYQPSVYDIDGDGNLEILMHDGEHTTTTNDIVIWDLVQWKEDARTYVGEGKYGPQVADVTGDGKPEVLFTTSTALYVFDKSLNILARITGLASRLMYPVVQDIDGDGYNEVVVASEAGVIYAYDTPARTPTPRPRTEVRFYSERRCGAQEYVPPPGSQQPIISDLSPVDGATDVPISISQLTFALTDFQKDKMNYTVTTSPNIGAGSGINVGNGRYNITVGNLEYATTYTWRISVTDGKHWTNATYTFTTQAIPPWYDTHWQYRKTITIDPSQVSSDQTDFPVLIDLTDSDLTGKTQTDGGDILFTDANNIKLNHEIESYDPATGHLIAWVNVPYVSSTTYTVLYMYYGNPTCTNQENPPAVWDTSNKLVLHLSETHECRFWGMIATETLPREVVINHLITAPYSLKALSTSNKDGWGIAYYTGTDPTVLRGPLPAYQDLNYDLAVYQMADSGAWIGVAHIRARSSGAIPEWGNPHPFMRYKNGKWWAFGHNGNLNKDNLKKLIGPEYLAANPPTVGTSWDDPDVVDSDLYMLYILKCIEFNGWNATLGIAQAIKDITSTDSGAANFFLTDGETLWGFRKGNTLYYYTTTGYSAIASQPPDPSQPGWTALSDYNLIILKRGATPTIITDIRQLYPLLVDSTFNDCTDSDDLRANTANKQDWYESRNDDPTLLTLDTSNVGGNTGKKAKFTASSTKNAYLTQEFSSPQTGTFSVQWDIYVDSILDLTNYPDRAGIMLIGSDLDGQRGPSSTDSERFVFLAFWKDGGATSGTAELVWMKSFSTYYPIATVNLDQWYTIKVVVDVPSGKYDVYLDGEYIATVDACTKLSSVTHISFAQWNDGAGAFYIDNVFAPAHDRYKLKVTVEGGGSVIVNPAEPSYAKGTVVTLTASPNSGWKFSGWSGDISSNKNPITITIDGNKNIVASFTEMLLVDSEFNDSTSSEDLRANSAGQDWYESRGQYPQLLFLDENDIGGNTGKKAGFIANSSSNAYLTQEFRTPQTGVFTVQWDIYVDSILDISSSKGPDRAGIMLIGSNSTSYGPNRHDSVRFVFLAFYKNGGAESGAAELVAMTAFGTFTNVTTVNLDQWYTIKVVVDVPNRKYEVYVDGVSYGWFNAVTAWSQPAITHISFAQWNDGAGAFYVDNVFAPAVDRYKLKVEVEGNGSVTINPGESTYAAGAEVTLTAVADPGYVFAGWSGDVIDHVNPITIIMDSDKTVKATFMQPQYFLTINIAGSGSVTKNPDKVSYNYGEPVTLTAIPSTGWTFQYWTGDLTGNENPATVIMDGDKTITVRFVKTGTCIDSTLNANDGTIYGGVTQGVQGQIDGAYTFNGINAYIEIPHSDSLSGFTEAFTVSFWLRLDNVNKRQTIINKYNTAGNQRAWYIEFQNHATYGKVLSFFASADGSSYREWHTSFNPTAGAWYYITVVWESGKIPRFYINGIQTPTIGTSTLTQIYNNVNTPLRIGRCPYDNNRYLQGSLDEIRISNPARSADYILTSYNNQKDPSTFYTIGEEETLPPQPFITDPYPTDGATNIPTTLTELSFTLMDYQEDPMDYYVTTTPYIGGGNATGVSNGRCTISISGLQYYTTYTWSISVTDGTHWTNRTFTFTTIGELLVDPEFNDSQNSEELRANSEGQDWYESRGGWTGGDPTLLYLDTSDVGGNTGKKAGFKASTSGNAYLTQEFSSPQTGTFIVQWDIYVDSILDLTNYPDRAGIMLIGSDLDGQKGPSSTDSERFVFLAFYKNGGATSGPVDLVAMSSFSSFTTIASGLNLKEWHTIKVVVNVTAGTYDVYVNGVYKAKVNACTKLSSVTHISFAQWNDGAGAFYIDNVYAYTAKMYTLTVNIEGNGQVQKEPDQAVYLQGTEVRLTAIPSTGWEFKGWSGDITGTETTVTIIMDSNKTVNATFIKVANEPPIVSNPEPPNGATNVPISTSQLKFTITDPDGDLMDYYVSTIPDIGSVSQTGATSSTYTLPVFNLALGTTYTWWVNVTDGTHWTNMTYTFTTETPLLVDSEFNDSTSSEDLRANGPGQDWYESRNDLPTLLYLDTSDVGGNTGNKAGFIANTDKNAYLTQEFSSPQTGTFTVQWDIYVDSILDDPQYPDRAGIMMLGTYTSTTGPNRADSVRFVFLAFYKPGGGTEGTADLVAVKKMGNSPDHVIVKSGLNLNQWYTIRVVVNVPAKKYAVYVDGEYCGEYDPPTAWAQSAITHISFAQWNDAPGAFYVDNVFAPAVDRYKLKVTKEGDGQVTINPGESSYAAGAKVNLTATPAEGWLFAGWFGGVNSTEPTIEITMDSNKVILAQFTYNNPPVASGLSISPEHPTTLDNLTASYTYYDEEEDPESGTEIRWYKNGVLQADLNDTLTVPYTLTSKDEVWYFTVRPKDGKVFGELVQSPNVTIENTPPTIDTYYPLTDPVISEGETQLFNVTYIDPNNDITSVVWFVNESQVWEGDEYTFIANYESEGIYNVTVAVQDASSAYATKTWMLTVHGVNRQPIITSYTPENLTPTVNEGESLEFTHSSIDPDDDPLYYTWLLDSSEVAYTQNWTFTPDYNAAGYHNVTLVVSDGQLFDSVQWNVTVINVNQAPIIDSWDPYPESIAISENENQTFTITYHDPDEGDVLTVEWFVNNTFASVGDTFTFEATYGSAGKYNITVIVTDPSFATATHAWILTVHHVNRPPVIETYSPENLTPEVNEGESLSFNHTSNDPDGDPLTYTWLLDGYEQAHTQNWTYTPDYNAAGYHNVTLMVSDGQLTATVQWNVTVIDVNRPPTAPTIAIAPSNPLTEDNLTCIIIAPSVDPDRDPVTYIYQWYKNDILQSELTADMVPYTLTSKNERWKCIVTPFDGKGYGPPAEVEVTIQNSPPKIETYTPIDPTPSINEGETLQFTQTSTDPDGDTLSYEWLLDDVFQSATQNWNYTPDYDSSGYHIVKLVVSDGTLSISLEWNVTVLNVNRPPEVNYYHPEDYELVINEGQSIEFKQISTDPDNDPLSYRWLLNGTEQATSQNWTLTTNYESAGFYNVTFKVSDGEFTITIQWNVTVSNVNRPPQIDSYSPATDPTILEGETQQFSISPSDPDNDDLLIQWYVNNTLVETNSTTYTFTSTYASAGKYNITVTVSDGLEQATHQWTLTVTDVGPTLDMPFNTDESPVAVDCSGYGNNGTIYGATWTNSGNGAYYFDGNDYIEVPDSASLDGGGTWTEITIEFWIRPAQYEKAIRLIEKRSAGSSYQIGFQTTPSSGVLGNQLYWNVWTTTGYKEIVAPFGLEPNVWSHVVCTYKDGIGMAIYVNGVLAVSAPHTGTIKDSTCPLSIGRYGGQNISYFIGLLDDIKIYTKALPQSLIQQNYDSSKDAHGNLAPIIISYSPTNPTPEANEGETLEFTQTSYDPDYDSLTYYWILDDILQATTQNWNYTPTFDDAGFHNVTLVVSDGKINVTQYWNVKVVNVNQAPVMTNYYPGDGPVIPEGQTQEFNITCSDPDNDPLLIQWHLNDMETGTTNSTYYTFPPSSAGTYHVAVKVSDGIETIWQNWTLTVTSGNLPPVIDSYYPTENPTILEGQSQKFNVTYYYPNSDPLTVQWYLNDTPTTNEDTYIFNSDYTSAGSYNVTVVISDGELSTKHEWTLTVIDQLLVDSFFDDSISSDDLRTNAAGQDWYESRGQYPQLLFLDENDIGGNTGKKAGFIANSSSNAYLTQEFSSPQTGVFTVQWDIYIDSILDISAPDRAGWMLIGDDSTAGNGPNAYDTERFVYMAFYKPGGGTTGTMDLVVRDRDDGWTSFTTIATGLNLKQWYTIKVVCNLTSDTYDIYVDGVYKATVTSRVAKTSVTHISFAQWNDGAGAFYVDNVFAVAGEYLGDMGNSFAAANTNSLEIQQEINVAYLNPITSLVTVLVIFNLRKNKRKRK